MALRLACKINSKYVQSKILTRSLSTKHDIAAVVPLAGSNEETNVAELSASQPAQYSVCKPKAAKYGQEIQLKTDTAQHLQPAMLPEYYQPPYQMQVGTFAKGNEEGKPIQQGHRRFEQSKTYANITLPIKAQKLANPFPDPVKMMASHTVSDQEKANQMLAESRAATKQSSYTTASVGGAGNTNVACSGRSQMRRFSSDCGVKKSKPPSKCKKMKPENCACPQAKQTHCVRPPKLSDCEKVDAPYPAYSESCHEDPDEKPSECKMCPWKMEDHPTFKKGGIKREMHTSANLHSLEKPGCPKPAFQKREPCGWVEKEKPRKDDCEKNKDPCRKEEKDDNPCNSKRRCYSYEEGERILIAQDLMALDSKDKCHKFKVPRCQTKCEEMQAEEEIEAAKKKAQKAEEAAKAAIKARRRRPKKRSDSWGGAWENYAMKSEQKKDSLLKDGWSDVGLNGAFWQPKDLIMENDGGSTGYFMSSADDDECAVKKKKPCCTKIEKGPCFDDSVAEDEEEDEECWKKTPGTYKCPDNVRKAIRDKTVKDRGGSRKEQLQKYKKKREKDEKRRREEQQQHTHSVWVPPVEEPVTHESLKVN